MQDLAEFTSANPLLVSGLIASALAVLFFELRQKSRSIGSLSAAMAVRLINEGSSVVDIRDADKFSDGHINAARNIPAADLLANPEQLKKSKKHTLLICENGSHSSDIAAKLRKSGLENIFSISGGLNAWQTENLPVVRDTDS